MITIDQVDDRRVDVYRRLRGREDTELLWVEGPTVLERLVASRRPIRSVLLSTSAAARLHHLVDPVSGAGTPVYVAPQAIVNEIVGFDLHRGTIAVAERPPLVSLDAVAATAERLVVLEGVNDPENLGAIARSARALGADGLVLDPTSADPYYRRSVRVSMGEILHLPVCRTPLVPALDRLAADGWAIWALTPDRAATPIGDVEVPTRLALVAGAEGPGLSEALLGRHRRVRIPTRPDVDSLNVGHAVAVALGRVAPAHLTSAP